MDNISRREAGMLYVSDESVCNRYNGVSVFLRSSSQKRGLLPLFCTKP